MKLVDAMLSAMSARHIPVGRSGSWSVHRDVIKEPRRVARAAADSVNGFQGAWAMPRMMRRFFRRKGYPFL